MKRKKTNMSQFGINSISYYFDKVFSFELTVTA